MKPAYYFLPLAMAGLLSACGGDSDKKSNSSSSASSLSSAVSSLSSTVSVSSSPLSSSSISSSLSSSSSESSLSLSSSSVSSSISSESSSESSSSSSEAPAWTSISLEYIGRYSSGEFGVSAAEIPAFDPVSKRGFIVNAQAGAVDVLDMTDPANPTKAGTLDATHISEGVVVNSVAVHGDLVALAVEAATKTDNGYVALYKASDLSPIGHVGVGAQPDMLTFTPDGKYILTANEGEPNDDYSIDPEGSISIVDVTDQENLSVATANFQAFNGQEAQLRASGVRIYGPGANAAKDLEPEYIAVSADSATAWVTLQENNALAKVDITTATVTDILPLGFKDHGVEGNGLDVTDTDGKSEIKTWSGLRGLYLPDSIAAYEANGNTYLVTANEGDARAWGEGDDAYWAGDASKGFVEEFRVKHLVHKSGFDRRLTEGDLPPQLRQLAAGALLNPEVFGYCGAVAGDPKACRDDNLLGRLTVTWTLGYRTDESGAPVMFNTSGVEDPNGDRLMYDALYSFGARSISIWNADGEQVWDSGDAFEQFLASDDCKLGAARTMDCKTYFNSNHEEGSTFDNRSDNKGPEPEGLTIGQVHGKTYVFVGLERMGGVLVYDISNPDAPVYVDYLNTREDWTTADPSSVLSAVGDLGPEGLAFISADKSPTGEPLLMVGNEVSGTTSIYRIQGVLAD
ncbi:choice-of-anchor I family protein [Cellvibrio japonicus]|uniref:Alkaline phosphatase-like protein n=1 Tax=Cellvibrio japonicus (strain Ueda107) TaxID=498211 RepID=B3PHW4_CELJU|nr:choice-of-anchor I family protein [Cellvibrio japonicus]ACE84662.1 alkaline phosphatase-like protein [Cellvibrio japonicus Ueda107]